VENDNAYADEFCAVAKNPAGLDRFDDGEEAKSVVNSLGNPTVSPGNVAKMNVSMPVRYGMLVARFSALADEGERLARPEVLTRIAAALDPDRRFVSQLCYPAGVGPHTLLLEEGQSAGPAILLTDPIRLALPSNKKRVHHRQRDCGPSQERAGETIEVPGHHRTTLPAGNQRRNKSDDERHPDWLQLEQSLDHCCFVHVAPADTPRWRRKPRQGFRARTYLSCVPAIVA
jgi:hypothetical protein